MATKTHNPPFVRFVRQVSNGLARPKSTFLSMMADNETKLRSAAWKETSVRASSTTTNAVTATDGVWDKYLGDWSKKPTYTQYIDERYDAYLQGGDGVVSTATMCGYAGIAAYRYRLPSAWTATTVEKVEIPVSVDKYLRAGARISLVFSDDETPSNDWDVIRGVSPVCWKTDSTESDQDGVASFGYLGKALSPFLTTSVVENGTLTVPVADIPSLASDKPAYMWIYLTPEDFTGRWTMYSKKSTRNYGIEGSAVIVGESVAVTFAAAVEPDEVDRRTFKIVKDGILPYIPGSAPVGEFHVAVRTDANPIIEDDGSQTPVRQATGDKAAAAIGRLFSAFYSGTGEIPTRGGAVSAAQGAAFNITRTTEPHVTHDSDRPVDTDVLRIDSAALVVPFVFPRDFTPVRVVLTLNSQLSTLNLSPGARFNVFLADGYLTSLTEEQLKNPGLYDGEGAPFTLLGTIDSTTDLSTPQHLNLTTSHSRVGTLVITGYFPPDRFDLVTGGQQGTGPIPFLPDISITD